jgi:biotin carboxyl carrier protein
MKITILDKEYTVIQKEDKLNSFEVNNTLIEIDAYSPRNNALHILFNNKSYKAELINHNTEDKTVTLKINNKNYLLKLKDETDELLERLGISAKNNKVLQIKAPMPGLVLEIKVKEGDEVSKGDGLLILEAMKMENLIKALAPGKVKKILISKGMAVEKNQPMIEME